MIWFVPISHILLIITSIINIRVVIKLVRELITGQTRLAHDNVIKY